MFDLAVIEQCAGPGLDIAVVERFISAVGSENPLAISITNGNSVILPEPPRTPDDAVRLAQHFVGTAMVREGITHFRALDAGLGDRSPLVSSASQPNSEIIGDSCSTLGRQQSSGDFV